MQLDRRFPPIDQVVLRDVLERQARERPDQVFAIFDDGTRWTYHETLVRAMRCANALRRLGVAQGDKVMTWLPNGPDAIRVWFALNCLGAVIVPINLSYRGRLLEHVIGNAGATLMIVHADLLERLVDIERSSLTRAVVLGSVGTTSDDTAQIGAADAPGALALLPAAALDADDANPPALSRPIAPWDTQSIIYTSGTTGPSKGVLSSYFHLRCMGMALQDLSERDRYFINLPLFHVGGTMPVTAMLIRGGSIVVVSAFDTDRFWPLVREFGITASIVLGAMAGFLLKRPVADNDTAHTLRRALIVPYNETALAFGRRFGCTLYSHFNMSEVSVPILTGPDPQTLGACGTPRDGISVRIVDENDCEVPTGSVGELIVRSDCPWALNHGYNDNPQATAQAWRNGWFHTGDGFRVDAQGQYAFVDRIKDSIRRRGENISSSELEAEVMAYPPVKEVAALATPSEHGEDEVLVVIVPVENARFDPAELIRFLLPRLPHFMVPRFVRIMTELPRTPTHKVQKHLLRAMDHRSGVWDREQAGIVVRGERIGKAR